jgi:hypothetical protein
MGPLQVISLRLWFASFLLLPIFMNVFTTPYMTLAAIAYLCLVGGLLFRRDRRRHIPLVLLGILIDLAVVLTLQVQRHAVQTAMAMELGPIQQCHIVASSLALVFYVPTTVLGARLALGNSSRSLRKWHKRAALTAFTLRSLGFLLMFSMLSRH